MYEAGSEKRNVWTTLPGKHYADETWNNWTTDNSTEIEKVDTNIKTKKKTKSISRKKDENLKKEAHDKIEKTNNRGN